MKVISFTKVKLPHGWLGNMSPFPITLNNRTWLTSEALFQALRFAEGDPVIELIFNQRSPMAAKMLAKSAKDRMVIKPQSAHDLLTMELVLNLKIKQHPELKVKLLETGDVLIIEDCTNRPHGSGLFWGAGLKSNGDWYGENHLGKIWMKIRKELNDSCK